MAEPVLLARGLRKGSGGPAAADGLDLEVARGEIFGLVGPAAPARRRRSGCSAACSTPRPARRRWRASTCGARPRRRLSDERYVQKLVDAGLDHVQITVESCDEQIHDEMMRAKGAFKQTIAGLKNALHSNLYVMTNTTMLRTNVHGQFPPHWIFSRRSAYQLLD